VPVAVREKLYGTPWVAVLVGQELVKVGGVPPPVPA